MEPLEFLYLDSELEILHFALFCQGLVVIRHRSKQPLDRSNPFDLNFNFDDISTYVVEMLDVVMPYIEHFPNLALL